MATPESPLEEPLRRHFVAIATGEYDHSEWEPLRAGDEVKALQDWLTDTDRLGERAFAPAMTELAMNPEEDTIRKALRESCWRADDAAVVYITGHGEKDLTNQHWTILKGTDAQTWAGAIRTVDILNLLRGQDRVGHLLFIVDSCYAAALKGHVGADQSDFPKTWFLLYATTSDKQILEFQLTKSITKTLAKLAEPEGDELGKGHQAYVSVGDFERLLKSQKGADHVRLDFEGERAAPHFCLPNPHYREPDRVTTEQPRRDLAIYNADFRVHWVPKAVGGDGTRWLFTGRAEVMKELVNVLNAAQRQADPALPSGMVTVVTGGAGCGKSAVLARLVTLSDPLFAEQHSADVAEIADDLKPRVGQIDVAIVGTGKHPEEVFAQLTTGLGLGATAAQAGVSPWASLLHRLTEHLSARTTPVTLVLDALDETLAPRRLVDGLGQLVGTGKLRLLLGVRSTGDQGDGAEKSPTDPESLAGYAINRLGGGELAMDAEPWWSQDDVRLYAADILRQTPGSPYAAEELGDTSSAYEVASVISQRAQKSFLIARLAAENLARRPQQVVAGDQSWHGLVSDNLVDVFRADLAQICPDSPERRQAVDLLRATAFAFGRGVPWRDGIWAAIANAIGKPEEPYGSRDIANLLNSRLSGYLVADVADDITVYRPSHDALRGALREKWHELLEEK